MTETILDRGSQAKTQYAMQPLQSTDTAYVAGNIVNQALKSCAREMGLDGPHVVAQHLWQDKGASCARFRHSLTKHVAQALGALDERVRAVYTPDNDTLGDDGPSRKGSPSIPSIDLLVWRQQKTTAFDSLVADLDRALVQTYKDTIGTQDPPTLLDVHVIGDADFEKHFGPSKGRRACMCLATYLLRAHGELVDIVYTRG